LLDSVLKKMRPNVDVYGLTIHQGEERTQDQQRRYLKKIIKG